MKDIGIMGIVEILNLIFMVLAVGFCSWVIILLNKIEKTFKNYE